MLEVLLIAFVALWGVVLVAPLLAGAMQRRRESEVNDSFLPTVAVVTPMYNEGAAIRETLRSIVAQDYPAEKLEIIVVDDCSTDDSHEHASEAINGCTHARILRNETNLGKRRGINRAVRSTSAEIIVSIDSDVIVAPDAVRQLVRRFTSPKIAAVGGRVAVRNRDQNWLTRMQGVKYFYGYHFLKNVERAFRKILCLSGCLTAYRRSVLLELESILENRNVLGVPIKYGEDRFLTRQIVKAGYQTTMTTDAVCRTGAPSQLGPYFCQQLRWRRSNVVDYVGGISHVWRVHPLVALFFYSLSALFVLYPTILATALFSGWFWHIMAGHLGVALVLGIAYRFKASGRDSGASAFDFLPMVLTMPITYGLLTPLALLTLDSGKWETRGHEATEVEDQKNHESVAPAMPETAAAARESLAEPLFLAGDEAQSGEVRAA